jgi:hypothetical protein
MGISRFGDKITESFSIMGLINNEWSPMIRERNYEAFLIKLK